MSKCSVEGCPKPERHKGLCTTHYKRWWRHGDPTKTLINMNGGVCKAEGCKRERSTTAGYCKMHHLRVTRYGREERIKAPDGAGVINSAGYRVLTINGERIYEHVHLAEKALGKKLPKKAVVHHMNNKPADNFTPLNLVVCPDQAYHMLLHYRARKLGYE